MKLPDARVAIHAALTAALAWIAVVMALPGDTFERSLSYRVMAQMGSEAAWAAVLWAVACVGAVGLATPRKVIRLLSVLVLATMHGVLALCFLVSNVLSTGPAVYSVLAGLGYYLAARGARDGL